jgi:hypothetical protein
MNIEWSEKQGTTSSPEIFGPPAWFTLHNGAAHLPREISPISLSRIKAFIDGIPDMVVACANCSEHARTYIESKRGVINNLKTGDDVFNFYVDFHNYVNEKLGKPIMSYEAARKLHKGNRAMVFKYY